MSSLATDLLPLFLALKQQRTGERTSWRQHKTGLLFRNLTSVALLGKPYYLLYIPIVVTWFKFLNSNPENYTVLADLGSMRSSATRGAVIDKGSKRSSASRGNRAFPCSEVAKDRIADCPSAYTALSCSWITQMKT